MNLSGPIAEHQNSLQRMYQKLADRFEENSIIQALWRDMSEDVSLQIQGLRALPSSFWNQLKKSPDIHLEAAVREYRPAAASMETVSLRESFELVLQSAEPVLLKIYARIVRLLRGTPVTHQSLDFYILVKAHVARIVRGIESFAGDPVLIRRAQLLLYELEKEVQKPEPEVKVAVTATEARKASVAAAKPTSTKATPKTLKKPAKTVQLKVSSPKSKSTKATPKRPKAHSKKVSTPVKKAKARR